RNREAASSFTRQSLEGAKHFQSGSAAKFWLDVIHVRHCPQASPQVVQVRHGEADEISYEFPIATRGDNKKDSEAVKLCVTRFVGARGKAVLINPKLAEMRGEQWAHFR